MEFFYQEYKRQIWLISFLISVLGIFFYIFSYYLPGHDIELENRIRIEMLESESSKSRFLYDKKLDETNKKLDETQYQLAKFDAKVDAFINMLGFAIKPNERCRPDDTECWRRKQTYVQEN